MTKTEKIKYLLVPAIGFGIGGVLLGLVGMLVFQDIKIGVILMGLCGSISLVLLENIKVYKKVLVALAGMIIWTAVIFVYIVGFLLLALPDSPPFNSVLLNTLMFLLFFWLGPVVIILFYALSLGLLLKIRVWPIFWRGIVGFLPAIIVGLILANVVSGELLSSELLTIFSVPALTGTVFGLFLGWGRYRGQQLKETEIQKREKT